MDLIHKTVVPASRVVAAATGRFAPELVQSLATASSTIEQGTALESLELVLAHLNRLELYRKDARGLLTLVAQTEIPGRIGSLARFPSPVWIYKGERLVRKDWLLVALEGGYSSSAVTRNAGQVAMIAMVVEFSASQATWVARAVYSFAQERAYVHQEEGIRDATLAIDRALEHVILHNGLIVGDGMWRRGGGYGEERPLASVDAFDASLYLLDSKLLDGEGALHEGRCAALVIPSWHRAYVLSPPTWNRLEPSEEGDGKTDGLAEAAPWSERTADVTIGDAATATAAAAAPLRGRKRIITEQDRGIHEQRQAFFYLVEFEPLIGPSRILDCCFLPGTALPTLVVLYEELPTWAGRVEAVSNTCALAAVILPPVTAGAAGEEPLVAWRVQGLPYDAEKVVPLPSFQFDKALEQGLLVVTANVLFWIRGNGQVAASLSGNHFGDVFMELDGCNVPGALYGGNKNVARTSANQVMHFQGACLAPLQISRLALVLADGSTCLLALQADMEAQLRLEPLKIRGGTRTAPAPVDVKLLSADLLFVAAHLGSSALFRVATSSSQQRRTRVPHGEQAVSGKFASREPDLELHQHDTIFQLGPVVDLVAIPPQFESRDGIQMPAELLCCTGHGRESFLARFIYHVQTRDWQRIPSSGCRRVWSLFAHDPSKPDRSEEQAYLLLSLAKSSVILDVRHGFEQAADSQVMLPSATIAAGSLDQHRLIAQVHRSGVRLLDSGLDLVLEYDVLLVTLEPGAAIIGASILDPYISLWLSDYRLTVLRLASRADDDQKESRYQLTTVFSTEGMLCATLYRGTLVNDFQTACSLPSEQIWSTPWTMTSKSTESYLRNAKTTASGTHDEMSLVLDSDANRAHTLDSPDLLIELAEEEQFLYGTNGWKPQPKRTQVPGDERILSSERTASTRAISRRSIPPNLDCFLAAATVDGALYLYGLAGDQPPLLLLQCKRFFLGVASIRDDRPNGVRPTGGDASWQRGAGSATLEMPLPENVPSAFGTAHLLKEDANETSSKSKPLVTDTYPRSSRDVTEATAKSFSEAASAPNEPVARRLRQGKVLDICLKDLGSRVCPVLAAILASGEVIIYKGFVAAGGKLCFTRIGGNALSTAFMPPFGSAMTAPGGGISSTGATTGATERDGKTGSRRSGAMRLMPFQNIQGKSGLTIIGQRVYIVLGDAGYPTVHPVRGPGLLSLTELHHAEACPYGFVSVATDGTVRIGQWPSLAHTRAVGHFLVQKHAWSESEYVERLLHDPSTDTILAIAGRSVPATEAVVRYLLEGNRYEAALRHARRKQQQKEQGNGTSAAAADVEVVAEHVSQSANARLSTAGRPNTRVRSLDKSIGQHGPVADVDVSEDAMEIDKDSNGTAALPVKTHELDESISLDEPDGNTDPMAEFEEQKRRRFQSERARDLPLLVDQHAVVLFARHSFEVLARYELEQTEVGLSMCSTRIRHFQRTADEEVPRFTERDVLVVGTTYVRGEDTTIRGRLLVFEISRQEGHGRTLYQMQTLAATEVKGAVSSVAPIKGGFICCSAGPRLEVYKLIEDEMSCISYYPGINLFFSHVTTLKQYILASDLRLGVSFLFWRERNVSQNFLCRDEAPRELVASEWVMHGTQACVISADMLGNILELSIPSPLDPESGGGTRMTFEAAMHIGSRANVLRRVRIDDPRIQEANNELPVLWNTHVVLVGTADGMISLICPLLRPTAKKLSLASLYLMLEPEVRKWALNARTFRTMRALTLRGGLQKSRRAILDGDVLQLYGFLDTPRRKEIARKLGVPQEILFESIFSSVEAVLQVL